MPNRRILILAAMVPALGTVGALLLLRSGEPEKQGMVRIPAPVETPITATPRSPMAASPSPTPAPTVTPGVDPPPPPQENGSPDYAKLGVQPAI